MKRIFVWPRVFLQEQAHNSSTVYLKYHSNLILLHLPNTSGVSNSFQTKKTISNITYRKWQFILILSRNGSLIPCNLVFQNSCRTKHFQSQLILNHASETYQLAMPNVFDWSFIDGHNAVPSCRIWEPGSKISFNFLFPFIISTVLLCRKSLKT